MALSMDNHDDNLNKTEMVLPAREGFANEAVQSIKSGKIIAVPADTLYGFACDACAGEETVAILEKHFLQEESDNS